MLKDFQKQINDIFSNFSDIFGSAFGGGGGGGSIFDDIFSNSGSSSRSRQKTGGTPGTDLLGATRHPGAQRHW